MNYPDHWSFSTFGSISEEIDKSGPEATEKFDYIEISSIDRDIKKITDVERISAEDASSRAKYHLESGDLLISKVRPKLNGVAVVPERYHGAIGTTGFYVVRSNSVDAKFLYYFCQTRDFIDSMDRKATGSSYPSVKISDIEAYEVPVPSIQEQERIVAKIEELFSKLDSGVSELKKAEQRLGTYRQALLNKATSGELTTAWRNDVPESTSTLDTIHPLREQLIDEKGTAKLKNPDRAEENDDLPSSWESATVKQISYSTRYGTSEKCDYDFDGAPVLRIPNIQNGAITLDNLKFARSDADLSNIDPLEPGDFLLVRTNGSSDLIGRAAVVREEFDEPTYFASYLIRFRITPVDPLPQWVNFVWNSWPIRKKILDVSATSAGQYNLSQSKVLQFELPIPPLEEQEQILEQVGRKMSVIDQLEQDLETELTRSKRLRQSILKHAFEGKLVPQDSKEEPSALDSRDTKFKPGEQATLSEVTSDVE